MDEDRYTSQVERLTETEPHRYSDRSVCGGFDEYEEVWLDDDGIDEL